MKHLRTQLILVGLGFAVAACDKPAKKKIVVDADSKEIPKKGTNPTMGGGILPISVYPFTKPENAM